MADIIERRIQSNGNTVNFNIDRTQPSRVVTVNGKKTKIYGTQSQLDAFEAEQNNKTSSTSNVKESTANRVTDQQAAGAIFNMFKDGKSEKPASDPNKTATIPGVNVEALVNPLEQFASYTPLFTLAAIEPKLYNDPEQYRNDPSLLTNVVFSSAGRFGDSRPETLNGTPEFYIDNVEIDSFVTGGQKTGNSNAVGFSFDLFEPYSVGLFLESLQIAALQTGAYASYGEAVFLLKVDFLGYQDTGQLFEGLASKFFTIKIREVKFEVDESGSKYTVKAIPFNHQAYSSVINKVYTDVSIIGENVKEALCEGEKSLINVLNRREQDAVKAGTQDVADVYTIEFPKSYCERISQGTVSKTTKATVHPIYGPDITTTVGSGNAQAGIESFGDNNIGSSSFGFTSANGGNYVMSREADVIDPETGKVNRNSMIIDPSRRQFQFPQDTSITRIINDIVLSSEYAGDAITKPYSPEGFVSWFKIDAQLELLTFDEKRGQYAKKIIFRVVPYDVHISIFSNTKSPSPGTAELEKLIAKQYDYIYTGQNNSILKFDINIDNLFFTGFLPQPPQNTGDQQNPNLKGGKEEGPDVVEKQEGIEDRAQISNTGSARQQKDPALNNMSTSSGSETSPKELVARNFQQAFLNNSGDLINIDLQIMGDPYWIVDNAIGNYFTCPSDNKLVTQDNTANFESGDSYIYIRLKTPSDVDPDNGNYKFANEGKDSPYSGIYKVVKCTNNFDGGAFTQKLKCIRMPGQAIDFDQSINVNEETTSLYSYNGKKPPSSSIVDDDLISPF